MAEIPASFLKKIRKIELKTRQKVEDIFTGSYKSVFHGRGLEFEDIRPYQDGDDVRYIDWNVSARADDLHVKIFREERELTLILAIDISASTDFGSGGQNKREVMAEIASVLAFSAIRNSDKVGLILFTNEAEKFVPPSKGRDHVMRIIREILYYEPKHSGTNLDNAFKYINNVVPRKSFVFMLSDFLGKDYQKSMRVASGRYDLVPIVCVDDREMELPNVGWVAMQDSETGEIVEVNTSSSKVRKLFTEKSNERLKELKYQFTRAGMDSIEVRSKQQYISALQSFFVQRMQ